MTKPYTENSSQSPHVQHIFNIFLPFLNPTNSCCSVVCKTSNMRLHPNSICTESLTSLQEEQSKTQNGSLCSVIVGNLAEVSLATQTWFHTEDEERWCCYNAAAAVLTSNNKGLDFVFLLLLPSVSASVIIVTPRSPFSCSERQLSHESSSEIFLAFTM